MPQGTVQAAQNRQRSGDCSNLRFGNKLIRDTTESGILPPRVEFEGPVRETALRIATSNFRVRLNKVA